MKFVTNHLWTVEHGHQERFKHSLHQATYPWISCVSDLPRESCTSIGHWSILANMTAVLIISAWWFHTFKLLSISYMGCHPSHWLSYFSEGYVYHQPDFMSNRTGKTNLLCCCTPQIAPQIARRDVANFWAYECGRKWAWSYPKTYQFLDVL